MTIETTTVNRSTVLSSSMCCTFESHCGAAATIARRPNHASATPRSAPTPERIKLSVRKSRTIRFELAPSASLMATSFCRAVARTRSNPATFAHAIRRTKPTAPCSTPRMSRRAPEQYALERLNADAAPFLWAGIFLFESCSDALDVGLRTLDRDIRLHASDDRQDATWAARLHLKRTERAGKPEVVVRAEDAEAGRHHANDDARRAVEDERAADDCGISSEISRATADR